MNSSLKERLGRLAQTRVLERVPSGSPAALVLRPAAERGRVKSLLAIMALVRRGVGVPKAKHTIEACLDTGRAIVRVPNVEDAALVTAEFDACGFHVASIGRGTVDVKNVRSRLGMTQEQFAMQYGLDLNSVQNWETGRRKPDAAVRSYLAVISRMPDSVGEALEEPLQQPT